MSHSTSRMYSTSAIRGALVMVHGSSHSTAADISFRTAFLAPEIGTLPRSGTPPSITYPFEGEISLSSVGGASILALGLYGGVGNAERDPTRTGNAGWRLLLVPRGGVRRAARRRTGDLGLRRRQRGQPDVRAGVLWTDRPCRGRPGDIRSERDQLSRGPGGVLHYP